MTFKDGWWMDFSTHRKPPSNATLITTPLACSHQFPYMNSPPAKQMSTMKWKSLPSIPPASNESTWFPTDWKPQLWSGVQFSVTLWTVAFQAPLSTGFSMQEHWSGLPSPSPGESSWPRDRTHVSCTGRQIPYLWAIRETHNEGYSHWKAKCSKMKRFCMLPSRSKDPFYTEMYTHGWFMQMYGKNHHHIVK